MNGLPIRTTVIIIIAANQKKTRKEGTKMETEFQKLWMVCLFTVMVMTLPVLGKKPVKPEDPVFEPAIVYEWGGLNLLSFDGLNSQRLTRPKSLAIDQYPVWSPDGQSIAFWRRKDQRYVLPVELCTIPPSGGEPVRVVSFEMYGDRWQPEDYRMEWTPDGSKIVYTSYWTHNFAVVDVATGQMADLLPPLTNGESRWVSSPSFSPVLEYLDEYTDLGRLALLWSGVIHVLDVEFVYNTDGYLETIVPIMDSMISLHQDGFPRWSRDGQWIAYAGSTGIGKVRPNGSENSILVSTKGTPRRPTWSPDGQWICFSVFQAGEQGSWDIYRIRSDGSELVNITNTKQQIEVRPDWNPMWTE
jgi:hypothetical protein